MRNKTLFILALLLIAACSTTETVLEAHGREVQFHLHVDDATVVTFPPAPIDGAVRWSSKTGFSVVPAVPE